MSQKLDNYRLKKIVGKGKYGDVYLAEDETKPGEWFAIKQMQINRNTETEL